MEERRVIGIVKDVASIAMCAPVVSSWCIRSMIVVEVGIGVCVACLNGGTLVVLKMHPKEIMLTALAVSVLFASLIRMYSPGRCKVFELLVGMPDGSKRFAIRNIGWESMNIGCHPAPLEMNHMFML